MPTDVSSESGWNNHVELGLWADALVVGAYTGEHGPETWFELPLLSRALVTVKQFGYRMLETPPEAES